MADSATTTIVVEGKDDRRFVRQYLQYLGFGELLFDGEPKSPDAAGKVIIRETNGIGALTGKKISSDIIQDTSGADKVLIIVDANADIGKRRKEMQNAAKQIKAKTDKDTDVRIFLLPDDEQRGELENLLLDIFHEGGVAECFEHYEKCLQDKKLQTPDLKGKIYAYCEAHQAETDANKRDYDDPKLWDLEHSALLPLRKFLRDNLPPPDGKQI